MTKPAHLATTYPPKGRYFGQTVCVSGDGNEHSSQTQTATKNIDEAGANSPLCSLIPQQHTTLVHAKKTSISPYAFGFIGPKKAA
jgi:hypothetical protein